MKKPGCRCIADIRSAIRHQQKNLRMAYKMCRRSPSAGKGWWRRMIRSIEQSIRIHENVVTYLRGLKAERARRKS